MKSIVILTTGGTLDKVHDTLSESLTFSSADISEGRATHLPQLLKNGRCNFPRLETILEKDSLDMTDADRSLILSAVNTAPEDHIVVTHGTGTMELTAKYLSGKTGDKVVILTGAMRPFSLGGSDAGFNVGGALVAAQTLPAGVYGVMNGRVFTANELHKDTQAGRFDS